MNEEPSHQSREQMEVRIVALLLGEAGAFETAEIEEAMQKDPELAAFHAEMRRTIELTKEASKQFQMSHQPAAEKPRLSPERREALLAKFKQGKKAEAVPMSQPPRRRGKWLVPASLAAGIIVLVTFLSTSRRGRVSTALNLTDARMMAPESKEATAENRVMNGLRTLNLAASGTPSDGLSKAEGGDRIVSAVISEKSGETLTVNALPVPPRAADSFGSSPLLSPRPLTATVTFTPPNPQVAAQAGAVPARVSRPTSEPVALAVTPPPPLKVFLPFGRPEQLEDKTGTEEALVQSSPSGPALPTALPQVAPALAEADRSGPTPTQPINGVPLYEPGKTSSESAQSSGSKDGKIILAGENINLRRSGSRTGIPGAAPVHGLDGDRNGLFDQPLDTRAEPGRGFGGSTRSLDAKSAAAEAAPAKQDSYALGNVAGGAPTLLPKSSGGPAGGFGGGGGTGGGGFVNNRSGEAGKSILNDLDGEDLLRKKDQSFDSARFTFGAGFATNVDTHAFINGAPLRTNAAFASWGKGPSTAPGVSWSFAQPDENAPKVPALGDVSRSGRLSNDGAVTAGDATLPVPNAALGFGAPASAGLGSGALNSPASGTPSIGVNGWLNRAPLKTPPALGGAKPQDAAPSPLPGAVPQLTYQWKVSTENSWADGRKLAAKESESEHLVEFGDNASKGLADNLSSDIGGQPVARENGSVPSSSTLGRNESGVNEANQRRFYRARLPDASAPAPQTPLIINEAMANPPGQKEQAGMEGKPGSKALVRTGSLLGPAKPEPGLVKDDLVELQIGELQNLGERAEDRNGIAVGAGEKTRVSELGLHLVSPQGATTTEPQPARIPAPVVLKDEIKANRLPAEQNTEANELVQNGKALFEAGRIQDAEARFNDVIKLDPLNKAGSYYLDEIRDQRHREENVVREEKAKDWMLGVDKGWRGDAKRNVGINALDTGIDVTGRQLTEKPVQAEPPQPHEQSKVAPVTTPPPVVPYVSAFVAADPQYDGLDKKVKKDVEIKSNDIAKPSSSIPATPQPEINTRENAFSTFSLNVSDVSFKLAAASLENSVMPDPASVRVEEFVNAFNYHDPAPQAGARLAFAWERAHYPFAHNRDMLRFAIQTATHGREAQKPLNLVILLDNSGSMERADRVQIVREAMKVLAQQLQPQDRISVIAFARTARLWVDGMAGGKPGEFLQKVLELNPDGGTNLEDALGLGYSTAARHFIANGVNRVILLTDGAANLGNVEPEALKQKVVSNRIKGIALDCFGIGWEGYNDDLLEVLSHNGDGRYGFLDHPEEAAPDFANQLAGALNVEAADVKTQVEFNPRRVLTWRQIGYAKHQLTKQQFRDNTVDAAELAASESGNALYAIQVNPEGSGPLGVARVRYKIPSTGEYVEQSWTIPYQPKVPDLGDSSPAMRLATTAAAFGEWLGRSPYAGEVTPAGLQPYLNSVCETYSPDSRPQRLAAMIRQAQAIAGK